LVKNFYHRITIRLFFSKFWITTLPEILQRHCLCIKFLNYFLETQEAKFVNWIGAARTDIFWQKFNAIRPYIYSDANEVGPLPQIIVQPPPVIPQHIPQIADDQQENMEVDDSVEEGEIVEQFPQIADNRASDQPVSSLATGSASLDANKIDFENDLWVILNF